MPLADDPAAEPETEIADNDVPLTDTPAEEPVSEPTTDIEDEETPLADLPEPEAGPEPASESGKVTEIEEDDVPLSDVPQTGEASTLGWLAVLLASGMGLVWLNTGKRKENG